MTPRPGTSRWEKLTEFLETTMMNAKSERVRLRAAMRLADLVETWEKRDAAEAARRDRRERALEVQKSKDTTNVPQPTAAIEPAETMNADDQRIQGVFADILNRRR